MDIHSFPVTIIIPAYNAADYICEALQSIQRLAESGAQIIVVNDGSNDNTVEVATKILNEFSDAVVLEQDNQGPAAARNSAFPFVKHDYILLLDADNVLIADVFEEAYRMLLESESVMAVYTDRILFGQEDGYVNVGKPTVEQLLAANRLDTCAIYRRKLFEIVGLFDINIPFYGNEDWEMWIRIIGNGHGVQYLKKPGFKYRVRLNSTYHRYAAPNQHANQAYIFQKHAHMVQACYNSLYARNSSLNQELQFALATKEQLKQTLFSQKLKSIGKILLNREFRF